MGKTKMNIVSPEGESKKKKTYEEKRAARLAEGGKKEEKPKKVQDQVQVQDKSTTSEPEKVSAKPNQDHLINRGKKYKAVREKVENKAYKVSDAVKLLSEISYSKFPGSVELHLVLNEGTINNRVELPHSTGSVKKIEIADDTTIEKLKMGKIDFDILLTSPAMMPKLVPFAKLLGPRGLMPNPKNGTVVENPEKAKDAFSGNSITIKTEKSAPLVHLIVGKVAQDVNELENNIKFVIENVGVKRLKKAVIAPSMGPGIQIQVS